jgi:hypothetical protein
MPQNNSKNEKLHMGPIYTIHSYIGLHIHKISERSFHNSTPLRIRQCSVNIYQLIGTGHLSLYLWLQNQHYSFINGIKHKQLHTH